MQKISNDRRSGERRSARLEQRPPRRGEIDGDGIKVLDQPRRKECRQLRHLRDKGVRCEIDCGADRAVFVAIATRLLAGSVLLRRVRCTRYGYPITRATNAVEMDVAKRQKELER